MRVLFWSAPFWPTIGGVGTLGAKLLPALRARGYEFTVVTALQRPGPPQQDEYEGIAVHRYPFASAYKNIDQLMEIRQRIAKLKRTFTPDLIHINGGGMDVFFHHTTASAYPTPLLVTMHDDRLRDAPPEVTTGNDTLTGQLLRSADWVSCVSTAVLTTVHGLVPETAARSSILYNGLDLPSLPPAPLPVHPPRLLCVGRLVARKGFDVALSALAVVARRFPTVRMTIAGDGPARAALESQVAELRLADSVDFTGWVAPENVPALMNTATIVVMPSRLEPFGLVALEAAQMARPIVATRVGGLPEIVGHGKTGFLVANENSNELAEAIILLLEQPEVAIRMGQAAQGWVAEKFGWDCYVDAHDTLYRQLARTAAERRKTHTP